MSNEISSPSTWQRVLERFCAGWLILTLGTLPIGFAHVSPSGYSFSIGGGCIEYGYGWEWIRQKMLPGPPGPSMGWSAGWLRSIFREHAAYCIPMWLPLVIAPGLRWSAATRERPATRRLHNARNWGYGLAALSIPLVGLPSTVVALLLVVMVLIPSPFVRMARRETAEERRMRRGLCPRCEYNLFGNESGTCPECGMKLSEGFRAYLARMCTPVNVY